MSSDNPFLKKRTMSTENWIYVGLLGAGILVFGAGVLFSPSKEVPPAEHKEAAPVKHKEVTPQEQKPAVPYITKDQPYHPVDGADTGLPKENILEAPSSYNVTIRSLTTETGADGSVILSVQDAQVTSSDNPSLPVITVEDLFCAAPCGVKINKVSVSASKKEEVWGILDEYLKIFPADKSCTYEKSCTYKGK